MISKREFCPSCQRPIKACYCEYIEEIHIPNQILIIRDNKEALHPFNTARMAELSIPNCKIIDSESRELTRSLKHFIRDHHPFILFKNEYSTNLETNLDKMDQDLSSQSFIVLDGTWKKAKRIYFENDQLQSLSCYHLDNQRESLYAPIRKACSEEFLSTVEAICSASEILNNKEYQKLLSPLKRVVELQSKWIKKSE